MAEQPSNALTMLTEFLSAEHIEAAARQTGFVQRTSKITGHIFLALVTFGVWGTPRRRWRNWPRSRAIESACRCVA